MPPTVQIEAKRLLKEMHDKNKSDVKDMRTIAKVCGVIASASGIPGGSLILPGITEGVIRLSDKFDDLHGPSEYEIELGKAARGERDTLPEPPPPDDSWMTVT